MNVTVNVYEMGTAEALVWLAGIAIPALLLSALIVFLVRRRN